MDQVAVLSATNYLDFKSRLRASGCSLCPELCRDRHNIVVDRGNFKSRIVIIGEAPGAHEDLQGQSFVGRAGKLLDKVMLSVGIDTNQDALILNVVKCRPPDNRPPKPEEAAHCLPYLQWQLKFVNPRIIVLLGATAAKYFLEKKAKQGMKNIVGQFFDLPAYPAAKFLLLYHPAYILRDPRKMKDMLGHVQALKSYLDSTR